MRPLITGNCFQHNLQNKICFKCWLYRVSNSRFNNTGEETSNSVEISFIALDLLLGQRTKHSILEILVSNLLHLWPAVQLSLSGIGHISCLVLNIEPPRKVISCFHFYSTQILMEVCWKTKESVENLTSSMLTDFAFSFWQAAIPSWNGPAAEQSKEKGCLVAVQTS